MEKKLKKDSSYLQESINLILRRINNGSKFTTIKRVNGWGNSKNNRQ